MPVPWEALVPLGLICTMFTITGGLLTATKKSQNLGKHPRWNIDDWDEMMMERDRRLTGHPRGQRSDPVAPPGYETSSVWTGQKAW